MALATFAAENLYAMKNFFLKSAAMLLLVHSCTEGHVGLPAAPVDIEGTVISHDMIVLGSHLEDPYSLDNMSKALASVYPTRADRVELEPTDIYVRFLPASDEEYSELEACGLQLLDHPVDYEILREGDYYHDPSVPEGSITWQYAVVGKDEEFPEHIRHEVLDECYIPGGEAGTRADWVDWEAVEAESFRLTGNAERLSSDTRRSGGGAVPAGRLTIKDDKYGPEPFGIKGVKVSCNSFVKFSHAYTDDDGNYVMDKKFSSNPRYRIVFKNRRGFAIGFNLLLVPASSSTLGKNSPAGASVTVTAASERKLFTRCAVNNAAYEYYEKCSSGDYSIKTPPANLRIWLFQNLRASSAVMMQQGAMIDDGIVGDYLGEYVFLLKIFLPDVTLGLKGTDDYAGVYSQTVHELAHASHFMQVGKDYWNRYAKFVMTSFVTSGFVTYGTGTESDHGYCEVGEMWAYYMQSMLYNERYPDDEKTFGTGYWFYPQLFMYLDDRGLGRFRIFPALTSDITDREMLKKKLTSLYPQFKSAINQAFGRYD